MIGLAVLYWVVLFAGLLSLRRRPSPVTHTHEFTPASRSTGFLSVLWSIRKTAAVRRYA